VPDLADMRRRGDGPRDVKIGPRTIRYQLTDVGSWKLQRIVKVDEPDRPGRT
jgi:predicted DNA-binding transcriptional regulator AlpA